MKVLDITEKKNSIIPTKLSHYLANIDKNDTLVTSKSSVNNWEINNNGTSVQNKKTSLTKRSGIQTNLQSQKGNQLSQPTKSSFFDRFSEPQKEFAKISRQITLLEILKTMGFNEAYNVAFREEKEFISNYRMANAAKIESDLNSLLYPR